MDTVAKLDQSAKEQVAVLERDLGVWLVAYSPGDAVGPPPRYTSRVRPVPLVDRDVMRVRDLERRLGVWLVAYDASVRD